MATPNTVLHGRLYLPDGTTFEDTASVGFTIASNTDVGIPPVEMVTWITDMFNETVAGQTNPLAFYISPEVTRGGSGCPIEIYDISNNLGGTPVGSPVLVSAMTLGMNYSEALSLPAQIAAVVAYRSAYGTDIEKGVAGTAKSDHRAIKEGAPATHADITKPRARDRGRIYLGPLSQYALLSQPDGDLGTAGQLGTVFMADLQLQFASAFGADIGGTVPFTPSVWSRVGAVVKPIAFYAIDAAVGVIRKRADTVVNRVLSWAATGAP